MPKNLPASTQVFVQAANTFVDERIPNAKAIHKAILRDMILQAMLIGGKVAAQALLPSAKPVTDLNQYQRKAKGRN